MRRRSVLACACAIGSTAVAGCAGFGSDETEAADDDGYVRIRDREGELEDDAITFETTRFERVDPFAGTQEPEEPGVWGILTNDSDVPGNSIVVRATFYDDDGSVLGEEETTIATVRPDAPAEFFVPLPADIAFDVVAAYDLEWHEAG